ncbi:unnamed protein product [Vitrella brassicaformis CCMP3155]|uniref:Transmembrane protein n=1 Tax=Vitrella brassicaformis (strain CCMP3155) TaxID=1169540 RepID=A0A0G4GK13_VITBC|nr:unnamed protein product [Vitrella brassicaformis CCMP3155]|eukprot:CEM30269.1 unnamed protein product [Vitrella brassicaformis CCMP3155]
MVVTWASPSQVLLIGLGSLCAPPLWWGIRCVVYISIVLTILIYLSARQQFGTAGDLSDDPLAALAWLAGAALLQFTLLVVISEPRVTRASTTSTGVKEIDVDHNRLSCCGRRAGWRPSATAERIAKARQTEPFLYRSVVKRWLKRMDYLTFIRLYKLLAVVGMAVDFMTDLAVGVELTSGSGLDQWRSICGVEWDWGCVNEVTKGYGVAGYVIMFISWADFVSLFLHYSIRGSPSLCQHIWIVAFALLEVPILVLTIVWATEASNPILFVVPAFFTLVTVLSRVASFAWTIYLRRKNGTAVKNTHEGAPSVV